MKFKKAIIIMTLLTLSFAVMGCGKTGTSKVLESSSEEYYFDKIELNKDNIFAFGVEKTATIESIVKKYGITTTHKLEGKEAEEADMTFLDDEEGIFTGDKGHSVNTKKNIKVNDGGENFYHFNFGATIFTNGKDESISSALIIEINDFKSQDFKFENYKMFKEIVQACCSKEYDINALEKKLNEVISSTPSGEKKVIKEKVGEFDQACSFYNNKESEYVSGKVMENKLTFFINLYK